MSGSRAILHALFTPAMFVKTESKKRPSRVSYFLRFDSCMCTQCARPLISRQAWLEATVCVALCKTASFHSRPVGELGNVTKNRARNEYITCDPAMHQPTNQLHGMRSLAKKERKKKGKLEKRERRSSREGNQFSGLHPKMRLRPDVGNQWFSHLPSRPSDTSTYREPRKAANGRDLFEDHT